MIRVICWNTRAGLLLRTWTSVASLALNRLKTSAKSLNEVAPISTAFSNLRSRRAWAGSPYEPFVSAKMIAWPWLSGTSRSVLATVRE